jgi:hypothetical protein
MIKITKTIKRECDFVSMRRKGKVIPVIIEICPGEMLRFHGKGLRRKVEISLDHCMVLADIMSANQEYRKAMDDYKAGKRKRRPKKAQFPYSKIYYNSLR